MQSPWWKLRTDKQAVVAAWRDRVAAKDASAGERKALEARIRDQQQILEERYSKACEKAGCEIRPRPVLPGDEGTRRRWRRSRTWYFQGRRH